LHWCYCCFTLVLCLCIDVIVFCWCCHVGATTLCWCCIFMLVLHLCIGATPLRIVLHFHVGATVSCIGVVVSHIRVILKYLLAQTLLLLFSHW
jgi:hypothetical protein